VKLNMLRMISFFNILTEDIRFTLKEFINNLLGITTNLLYIFFILFAIIFIVIITTFMVFSDVVERIYKKLHSN
jgi:hypothetical protein